MTSKARRKRREWMQAETERRAEMLRAERERADRRVADMRRQTDADWRMRTECVIPSPDDEDVFYPQGRLDENKMVILLAVQASHYARPLLTDAAAFDMRYAPLPDVAIRARQNALRLPTGLNVVWWSWEVAR